MPVSSFKSVYNNKQGIVTGVPATDIQYRSNPENMNAEFIMRNETVASSYTLMLMHEKVYIMIGALLQLQQQQRSGSAMIPRSSWSPLLKMLSIDYFV